MQEKTDYKSDCDSILLKIKEIKNLKIYEIADILGLDAPETVSRGKSRQVLNSLKLLLENLQLRAELQRIEAAKREFYTPSPFVNNDAPDLSSSKLATEARRIASYKAEELKQRRRKP